jgi:DNA-nicking Smr family endonuclease
VELAAILLRHTGVDAKVKKECNRDEWYVYAYTDMHAAGRKELRDAIAELVRRAVENGWVEAGEAEG